MRVCAPKTLNSGWANSKGKKSGAVATIFGIRICEQWNHLPGDVVSSSRVNIFKGRLDNYLRIIGGFK